MVKVAVKRQDFLVVVLLIPGAYLEMCTNLQFKKIVWIYSWFLEPLKSDEKCKNKLFISEEKQ